MREASCRRDDLVGAFEDLCQRLERRRAALWTAYRDALTTSSPGEYAEHEQECWSILSAGLSGLAAEQRMLQRDFDERMALIDEEGAVA